MPSGGLGQDPVSLKGALGERRLALVLSLAATVAYALIALLTTPVIVAHLGVAAFGTYSMALAVLAVMMLFDGGLTDAVVRHLIVRELGAGAAGLPAAVGAVLPLYGKAIAALAAAGSVLLSGLAIAGASGTTLGLGALALVGTAAALAGNPFRAAMLAAERFVAARLIEVGGALATAVLTVAAAQAGGGPVAVFAGVAAGLLAVALLRIRYVWHRLGRPTLRGPLPPDERRALRRYAAPILLGHIVEALYWRVDVLLAGILLGPASAAIYAVALVFQKHVMRLSIAISRIKMPETIRLVEAAATPQRLAMHLERVARLQALFLGGAVIALAAFGDAFLALWLGPAFVAAHPLMLVVLVPYCIEQVGSLRNVVLQARHLYGVRVRQGVVLAVLNVVATALLLPHVGLSGAAMATAAGLLVGLALANHLLARRGGVDLGAFHRALLRRAVPPLLVLAGAALALDPEPGASWGALSIAAGGYGLAFVTVGGAMVAEPADRAAAIGLARNLAGALWRRSGRSAGWLRLRPR